jgi:agmatine deiminase
MAWPCREEVWGDHLEDARAAYADVARAIARFEPVTMIADPAFAADVTLKCGSGVTCMPADLDDSWFRDSGPSFVIDGRGGLAGVDWIFNAWGRRYRPYDRDAAIAETLLERLSVPRYAAPLVAEGGGIHVDGEGTLIAVEETLINDNRNPGKDKAAVEEILKAYTGTRKVIWLTGGLQDDETDGHVDNVACFVRPGVVAVLSTDDREDGNYAALAANRDTLRAETDAAGRPLEVVEIPQAKARWADNGERLSLSYINFYLPNGGVVLPAFDDPADDVAYDVLESLFPDRELVQVPALDIVRGGGGIHCITQQQPKAD